MPVEMLPSCRRDLESIRNLNLCDASPGEQHACEGEEVESRQRIGPAFVVAGQTAEATQPAETPLDDPAP